MADKGTAPGACLPTVQEIRYLVPKERRVDRVPNRKVSIQKEETSVLGPQCAKKHGSSPEQESTDLEPDNSFSAWSLSKLQRRESRPSPE